MKNNLMPYKKKILIVVPSLTGGGVERVTVHLANYLYKGNYDISLVLFENKNVYKHKLSSGITIKYLNKINRWDFLKVILKLKRVVLDFKPDIVLSLSSYANYVTILVSILLKKRFKIIISEHTNLIQHLSKVPFPFVKKMLIKFTYNKADKIISVSEKIREILFEELGITPTKIITIYNPVSLDMIASNIQEKISHPFLDAKDNQLIISVGRLTEVKRFDLLLRAFSLVRKKEKNLYLIVLGEGMLRKQLESLSCELNISKWVDFVGFKSNPYPWITMSDVFVLSSDYEGFPIVILESMACGTPIISTDYISGASEIITHGKNGILVPRRDEKALADAIAALLEDKNLQKKFSEEGRKKILDFRVENIFPQYEKLFR